MTAELVRGQNHPLPAGISEGGRLEVRVTTDRPVIAGATLGDADGKVHRAQWVAHPGSPQMPGLEVSRQAAAAHRLAVDLGAMPEEVARVHIMLALPVVEGAPARFGAVAAPFVAVTGLDGAEVATFTVTELDSESAVVAIELYRRQGAWKVRAVGQGYAGGLAAMLRDQGLPEADALAGSINEAVARGLARSVAPAPVRADADRPRRTATVGGTADAQRAGTAEPGTQGAPLTQGDAGQLPGQSGTGQLPGQGSAGQGSSAGLGSSTGQGTADQGDTGQGGAGQSGLLSLGDAVLSGPLPQGDAAPGADDAPRTPAASGSGPLDYRHPNRPAPPAQPADGASAQARADQTAADHGPVDQSPADQGPGPVAGNASGWSMEERLYNQVWGMFEDLARTTAAYRSAVDFAESRMERELDKVLSDPETRVGPAADAAGNAARTRHGDLVDQARASIDRDLEHLAAESAVVEPALPPAFADWDSAVWTGYRSPMETPMAVRLGDLHLPESPELRIPMLVRLPLERGLWIDAGRSPSTPMTVDSEQVKRLSLDTAVSLAVRLLASYPAGDFTVNVVDPAGSGASSLAPLSATGALKEPPAAGAGGVTAVIARLVERVDLVQMAMRARASDALPPHVDTSEQLLIVNDFPFGFDDRAVTQLRYLADEGPSVGVHLMMVADRDDARMYGPVLDPLWRALLRLTPTPDDHLADPWVGHAWTYSPLLPPAGSQVLHEVARRVAESRLLHEG